MKTGINKIYTKADLQQQLKDLGIQSTDTVMIHTSMKQVGNVEGGADGFIDAFCEYLKDGLFLVPTHTWDNVTKNQPIYDVNLTIPCIGIVPQIAAFRKDGYRSLHPTHSIWGYGKEAKAFLSGEEKAQTPSPVGFAWSRLKDVHAKILLIGVKNNKNTFIHAIDEFVDLPDRLHPIPFDVTIIDHEGHQITHPFYCHYCSKTSDVSQYFVNFEKALVASGAQSYGYLGDAKIAVVDAKKCHDIISKIYQNANEDLCIRYMEIEESYYQK